MRLTLFLFLFLLFVPHMVEAAELARNVETAPISDVPPPEDAPKLPPPSEKASSVSSLSKNLQAATPAKSAVDGQGPVLSAQDHQDLNRISDYLNHLKSISADFLQIDDQGNTMRGTLAIVRPGKMRVTYAPPSKDFIVADGDMVHIWDGDLKSQTNLPERSSLANFILRDPIVLSGDVRVDKFDRYPAKLEMTLVQTNDPGSGKLTLIFEDHPLILRQWRVIDAQGRSTGVNLENEELDVHFPNSLFNFTAPSFGNNSKSQIP